MKVKIMQVGPIGTNCYFLIDTDSQPHVMAVIDPGDEPEAIQEAIQEVGAEVKYILLTHGHYDHTTAVPALHRVYPEAEIYIHEADAQGAGSHLYPLAGQVEGLKYYDEGDTLTLGTLTISVMHTPGHSPGSVTLQVGDVLFTGDTLFAGSCGRTDLPGGNFRDIMASLKRLGQIQGNFHVCPGHDMNSTLAREKQYNPYLREAMRDKG